ncbi:hypothetical protein SAMN00777080_2013 [Aquiflexum balticum DSM 16537]|uniref:Uncharacterized protein n=1 Tax=Aquiflexum balticum DSM 16537 TaxID=758820 RepID=A0A1W2H3F4_9BACT|nr:hypothetical protein [Aquiflexum balticum]SMD43421.1 hypothetical protein SAMN00777080_2013 [Aquiflexum balticum DSM 16537]
MKKLSVIFILLLLGDPSFLLAQTTPNVNGTWIMQVETDAGSGSPTFVLEQVDATNLKGTYSGLLGSSDVKGTLKGNIIHLEFKISGETIEYEGVVDGDELKGKVKLGSMAEGTFTGKKKKTD